MPNQSTSKSRLTHAGALLAGLVLLWTAGCRTPPLQDHVWGPSYAPTNVYRAFPYMPMECRRVALLPLATPGSGTIEEAGRKTLEPVLLAELSKTHRFEVIPVSTDQMKQWTGKPYWTTESKLPPDFFKRLEAETGADAFFFPELTRYDPYQPVTIGWRLKLVGSKPERLWWSVDEVFDAGNPEVVNGARRYYQDQRQMVSPKSDSRSILRSPRQFGHYTLWAVLESLPKR